MKTDKDVERRHKTCAYCQVQFCDVTRRPDAGRCCTPGHSQRLMVQTRKLRGSYACSKAQSEKAIATIRCRYGSFAACQSDESRKKNSEKLKAFWASGEMARKTKETSLMKFGVEHWSQTTIRREFTSKLHAGRVHSSETRKKMSELATKRLLSKREVLYTSANGGFRSDLGLYFRSNWEANFARILQFKNKQWKYEPTTFELGEGTYTPDFSVEGVDGFIEVKGRVNDDTMKKVVAFKKLNPGVPITLIDPIEYDKLRKRFKKLVAWEGR